jgi:hypothetical protein
VVQEGVEVALQVLGRLLVREGEHLLDELGDGAVVVRPGGVDVEEEPFEEGAFAGGDLDQPADEQDLGAKVGIRRRPGALQHQAADQLGVPEGQLLGDDAAAGEAGPWVEGTSSARRTAAASSAISSAETGRSGMAVRPAPRLSKAVRR